MVNAYPVREKKKSIDICQAFVDGCGGKISYKYEPGVPAFFYGVTESNKDIWQKVKRDMSEDFYYCDNSYFDVTREKYFRITKNRIQHVGTGASDCKRFDVLGVEIKPWAEIGNHIVLCPQSIQFMQFVAGVYWDWTAAAEFELRHEGGTLRELRVRKWSSNKLKLANSLENDLQGAHALVTYSSAAAVTSILNGIPVACNGPCAASIMGGNLGEVENLPKDGDRHQWAGVLADNQWTLEEMRSGMVMEQLRDL